LPFRHPKDIESNEDVVVGASWFIVSTSAGRPGVLPMIPRGIDN
jgi:hypothetical protein